MPPICTASLLPPCPKGILPTRSRFAFTGETPLDAQTETCLDRLRPQLELFRQATSAQRCNWGPAIVGGKYASALRGGDVHDLETLVLLNMRSLVAHRHAAQALDDAMRLTAMARQVSQDESLVARQDAETLLGLMITQLAELLPDVPKDVLRQFAPRWTAQRPLDSYADVMLGDAKLLRPAIEAAAKEDPEALVGPKGSAFLVLPYLVDESEPERESRKKAMRAVWLDPVRRSATINACTALEREEPAVLRLPEERFGPAAEEFMKRVKAEPWGPSLVPNVEYLHRCERRAAVERALLEAAIAVRIDGKDALARIKDPAGDAPFTYTPTQSGYVLSSKLLSGHQPVSLCVGPASQK